MTLILPSAISPRNTWDQSSAHPRVNGRVVPNKDTSMDWPEHQLIVLSAAGLLVSAVPEEFAVLRQAFHGELSVKDGNSSTVKIYVSKGIHQPETNPHIQLETEAQSLELKASRNGKSTLVPSNLAPTVWKYHLNVSAVASVEKPDSFQWVGVQFTRSVGATIHSWPLTAVVVMKAAPSTLGRRNSISSAGLQAHVDALRMAAELEQFEKECLKFELTHQIKPIDRKIRNVPRGWGAKPVYTGEPLIAGGKKVTYNFDNINRFVVLGA